MRKAQNVIKIVFTFLVICILISCKTKSQLSPEIEFLGFYISENYSGTKKVLLNSNNSNEYILKALKRHLRSNPEPDSIIKKLLVKTKFEKIKDQTTNITQWDKKIVRSFNSLKINIDETNPTHISKPIFIDNYCLIYSYNKTKDIYFIPSIEVFEINGNKWEKISNIKHFN